jgi:hypothetical protein
MRNQCIELGKVFVELSKARLTPEDTYLPIS